MHVSLIMLAAGSGSRMGSGIADKLLIPLAGMPVFGRSLRTCLASGVVDSVVVVYRDAQQQQALQGLWSHYGQQGLPVVWTQGGRERADSVRAALAVLPADAELVLIHDAARPLVQPAHVAAVATAARQHGAAVLAHRVTDTLKRVAQPQPDKPQLLEDLQRSRLWAMETPQAFKRALLEPAYAVAGSSVTDDTAALSTAGHPVFLVENLLPNPKITLPSDLDWAEFLLSRTASQLS